jgi:hypothetical protein
MTWFALLITWEGGLVGAVPFPDAMSCGNALPAIHGALSQVHPDIITQCKDTGIPKVRPRARGDN